MIDPLDHFIERLLALDDSTAEQLRGLAESLPPDKRREFAARLEGRKATLSSSQLGDLGRHAQELREAARLLDNIQQNLEGES